MFFIDTSKISGSKLESQVVTDSTAKNNWTYTNSNDYPVAIGVESSNEYDWLDGSFCKVDGYNAYPQRKGQNSYLWFLNPRQTLQIQNLSVREYCVFPLLPVVDESGSGNGIEVDLIDNHDSNVINLVVTQSPANATITYFVSSSPDTSNASW